MASSSFSAISPPLFDGENYQIWAIKFRAYLQAQHLWDVVEFDEDPEPLRQNPTLAQIKKHEEDVAKKPKALNCIHSGVTNAIFTRIMACTTPKQAWDKLKGEFEGVTAVIDFIRIWLDDCFPGLIAFQCLVS